jgi:predicted MPP superfamily phosphohydrolase
MEPALEELEERDIEPSAGAPSAPGSPYPASSGLQERLGEFFCASRLRMENELHKRGGRLPVSKRLFRSFMRITLKSSGAWWLGRRNCSLIEIVRNDIYLPRLPKSFDGLRLLHLSDLHVNMHEPAFEALLSLIEGLEYDLCVITGDFRAGKHGELEEVGRETARLAKLLRPPVLAVLGNHDSIYMIEPMEKAGMKFLVNENHRLARGEESIFIAGIDDPSHFRLDNLEKATAGRREGEFSILLSHSPETYRQAANARYDLMLCGHTHGGQICLPGGVPITLETPGLRRKYGSGPWRKGDMRGYTSRGAGSSVAPVRINCRPEIVIPALRQGWGGGE